MCFLFLHTLAKWFGVRQYFYLQSSPLPDTGLCVENYLHTVGTISLLFCCLCVCGATDSGVVVDFFLPSVLDDNSGVLNAHRVDCRRVSVVDVRRVLSFVLYHEHHLPLLTLLLRNYYYYYFLTV